MNREDFWGLMTVLVVVTLFVSGLIVFVKGLNDCNQDHGMYVRKMNGLYSCVEKGQH